MTSHPWLPPAPSLLAQVRRAAAAALVARLPGVQTRRLGTWAEAWSRLLAVLPSLLDTDAERVHDAVARLDVMTTLSDLTTGRVDAEPLERALLSLWLGLAGHPGLTTPLALPGPFRTRVVDPRAPRLLALGNVRGLIATARGPVVLAHTGRLPPEASTIAPLPCVGGTVIVCEDYTAPAADVADRVRAAMALAEPALPAGLERVTITIGDAARGRAACGEARAGAQVDAADLVASAQAAFVRQAAAVEPVFVTAGVLVEGGRRVPAVEALARACGRAAALPWRAGRAREEATLADEIAALAALAEPNSEGERLLAAIADRTGAGVPDAATDRRRRALLVNVDADEFVYAFQFGQAIERRCAERRLWLDRISIAPKGGRDLAAELGGPVPAPAADGSEVLLSSEQDPTLPAVLRRLSGKPYDVVIANVRPGLFYDLLSAGLLDAPTLAWDRHLHGGLREEGERRGITVDDVRRLRIEAWSLADEADQGIQRDLARAGFVRGSGHVWPLDLGFFRATTAPRPGLVFAGGDNGRDWAVLLEAVRGLPLEVHLVTRCPPADLPANVRHERRLPLCRFRDAMAGAATAALPMLPDVAAGVTVLPMAMALGVAVVATRTHWTEQYVRDGEEALLVPAGDARAFRDALVRLHEDPELRGRLAANARQRVAELCDLDAFTREMFATLPSMATSLDAGGATPATPWQSSREGCESAPASTAAASPSSGPSAALPERLRQLWDGGRRREAIRAAIDGWEQLLAGADDLDWLQNTLHQCGLHAEALALHVRKARRRNETREWEAVVGRVLRSGDSWWARDLLAEAGEGSRELRRLRIEAQIRLGDAAEPIAAWVRDYRDEAALETAVEWWLRSGRVEEVERLLEGVAGLPVWRARLALWRNQAAQLPALLRDVPPGPERRLLEGVAAALQGRWEDAESLLRGALESKLQGEAGTWLATALRKQGRYSEALSAAQDASMVGANFDLVARIERELAADYERAGTHAFGPPGTEGRRSLPGLGRTIQELEHAEVLYSFGLHPNDSIFELEGLVERFAGNHTVHLTTLENGRLRAHPLAPDPRFVAANIQLVAWTRGADAARALFQETGPRMEHHPLFRIYEGELELWMGDYEKAERIFRDILAKKEKVLWAWIGLGASVMFQGNLRGAQEVWKRGLEVIPFVGPTLYVYRGECYRRQGDAQRARLDLETAVRDKPYRLSGWINLALLDGDPEALRSAEQRCAHYAPLLMEELTGSPAERLEKALVAMRGNRSSARVSYHLWGRLWNFSTV